MIDQSLILGGCKTGTAKITKTYKFKREICNSEGTVWRDGTNGEPKFLVSFYPNSLQIAVENQNQTLVFQSISTGIFCYPYYAGT